MASILKNYRKAYKQQKVIRQQDPPPTPPESETNPIWEYLDKYGEEISSDMAEEVIVLKFHQSPEDAEKLYIKWRQDYLERELDKKPYRGRKRRNVY